MTPTEAAQELERLHTEVDARAAQVAETVAERLMCQRGCHECCVDELTVFEVEADRLRRSFPEVLAQEPGPAGGCAFLDTEGACRVYAARPYVCRTQGLPLRWLDEEPTGQVVERRDVCPLNDHGQPPLEELPQASCWTLGPVEERLQTLQRAFGGELTRVGLRTLFRRE